VSTVSDISFKGPPGLNHLAFHAGTRDAVDRLAAANHDPPSSVATE